MSHAINDVQDDVYAQGASKCDDVENGRPCKVHVKYEPPSNDLWDRNQCQATLNPIGLRRTDLDHQCEDT